MLKMSGYVRKPQKLGTLYRKAGWGLQVNKRSLPDFFYRAPFAKKCDRHTGNHGRLSQ